MKKISILLVIILIIMVFMPLWHIVSFADEDVYPLDQTNILDDLEGLEINGQAFDIDNYGVDNSKNIELVYFLEFGYGIEDNQYYSLYLYIYNPQDLDLWLDSQLNKVQMKYNNESWEKYDLIYLSKDKQIIKYRVDIGFGNFSTLRSYNISGVELRNKDSINAVDYNIGVKYTYTGVAENITLSVEDIETIELDVKSTNFRTPTSATGKDYYHDLNSVYFSVPNDILNRYGSLNSIRCEFYEYKTAPIIVTNNLDIYGHLNLIKGIDINSITTDISLGYNYCKTVVPNGSFTSYDWSFNIDDYYWSNWMGNTVSINSLSRSNKLYNIFYNDTLDDISADTLRDYIYGESLNNGVLPIKDGTISASLFKSSVDLGRKRGYNDIEIFVDDTFDLLSYSSSHSWFDKFNDYGFWSWKYDTSQDFKNVEPIKRIDTINTDGDLISDYFLINELDSVEFINDYYSSSVRNETMFLFRFANTDYFSGKLRVEKDGQVYENSAYMAEQTVFFDFDVITLTFKNEEDYTVLPVVASPIDIINEINKPALPPIVDWLNWDNLFDTGMDWLNKLISVVLLIVLIIVLMPILPYIIKFIIWLILLPIRLIRYIIGQFRALKRKE